MLFKDKRGLIQKSMFWIFVALALLTLMFLIANSQKVSAGTKANQYYIGNNTCENFTDSVLWSVLSTKSKFNNKYLNWTPDTACPGTKNCDMVSLRSYIRYASVGTATMPVGGGLLQIANRTQSPMPTNAGGNNEAAPAEWGSVRYAGYLNQTVVAGDVLGPRYECGNEPPGQQNNTCDTAGKGYNESFFNYSVRLQGGSTTANTRMLLDTFEIKYPWCWTPLIYDATVTPEVGVYSEDTFTFTINVTNPGANTTVRLLTRTVGGTWSQEGNEQYCFDCAQEKLSFNVNFSSSADREFKFNATDNESFSVEAGASSTTNECLDGGNDCVFKVNEPTVAEGTPVLEAETANGQTSGAEEGWGSNWTFVVNVSNPADGAGDIELNLSIDSGAGFVVKENTTCSEATCSTPQTFTFYVDDFLCTDISSAQYKFTATNLNGTSTVAHPFTIEKDDTTIEYIQGNNTITNRSGNQTQLFIMRINDTDKGQVIDNQNVTFEVTYNFVDYSAVNNESNSSGYSSYYFNPVCTPNKFAVGDQNWRASIPTNTCYKSVTSSINNVSIRGDIILDRKSVV